MASIDFVAGASSVSKSSAAYRMTDMLVLPLVTLPTNQTGVVTQQMTVSDTKKKRHMTQYHSVFALFIHAR
jgi:hypothetical protein